MDSLLETNLSHMLTSINIIIQVVVLLVDNLHDSLTECWLVNDTL